MASNQRKVRFTSRDEAWIASQAATAGESFSEFVRVAALARAWIVYASTDPGGVVGFTELVERTKKLIDREIAA